MGSKRRKPPTSSLLTLICYLNLAFRYLGRIRAGLHAVCADLAAGLRRQHSAGNVILRGIRVARIRAVQGVAHLAREFEAQERRVLALALEHGTVDELIGVGIEHAHVGAGADRQVTTLGDAGKNGSLRQAYALLQGIDGQVASLKENTAGLRGQNPGLDTLVNNLEVLATTEKFKFNRGDYNV